MFGYTSADYFCWVLFIEWYRCRSPGIELKPSFWRFSVLFVGALLAKAQSFRSKLDVLYGKSMIAQYELIGMNYLFTWESVESDERIDSMNFP